MDKVVKLACVAVLSWHSNGSAMEHVIPVASERCHVHHGPMFGGKTTGLLQEADELARIGKRVALFKPIIDDRYSSTEIVSHNGIRRPATPVSDPDQIMTDAADAEVVGIDEAQFFPAKIVEVVRALLAKDKTVVIAGLNEDFRGEPFGAMPLLMQLSKHLIACKARCEMCGQPAQHTQRLVNGEPAKWNDPIVMVGGANAYQPRCAHCYVRPQR